MAGRKLFQLDTKSHESRVERCEKRYVRHKNQIGYGELATDEPFLLGQHRLEDAKDAPGFIVVPVDGRLHLLRVDFTKPPALAVVRAAVNVSSWRKASRDERRRTLDRTSGKRAIGTSGTCLPRSSPCISSRCRTCQRGKEEWPPIPYTQKIRATSNTARKCLTKRCSHCSCGRRAWACGRWGSASNTLAACAPAPLH